MTTRYSDPLRIGNAYGPGRPIVICLSCGATVLTPYPNEVDWRELHRRWHDEAHAGAE